jgi:hypothetical protein
VTVTPQEVQSQHSKPIHNDIQQDCQRAFLPRRRSKKDEEAFRDVISQLAGHANAIYNDGIESEEDDPHVSGTVGIVVPQRELMDMDEEDVDTDAQQLVQEQLLERLASIPHKQPHSNAISHI